MYPGDSITIHDELIGAGSHTLVDNTHVKYILQVSIQQSATNSISKLMCGSQNVALNYGKDFPSNQIFYRCTSPIIFTKTGNDDASILFTYSPSDLSIPATTSARFEYIDMASQSALATALSNQFWYFMILGLIITMYIGWRFGIWLYRR